MTNTQHCRYLKLSLADRIKHLESKMSLFADLAVSCSGAHQPARIMDMNAVEGRSIYEPVDIASVEASAADLMDAIQKVMADLRHAQSAKQAPEAESKQPVGLPRRLPMTASEVAAMGL